MAGPVSPAPTGEVKAGNRTVVVLRGTILPNAPADRARIANEKIEAAINAGGSPKVSIKEEPDARLLLLDGRGMFVVTADDLDEAAGKSLDQVATEAASRLEAGVREALEQQSLPAFLRAIGASTAASLVLVLVLVVLERLRRWAASTVASAAHQRLGGLTAAGQLLFEKERVQLVTARVVFVLVRIADVFALYVWLAFVLGRFGWTRPWSEQLGSWLVREAGALGLLAVKALPNLVLVAIIFVVTRALVRLIDLCFTAIEEGRIQVSETIRETTQPTRRIVNVIVWVFAVIMAYPYLPGSGSEAFKGVTVMVGLMISLGSSTLVGQLASGLMLMYSRTLRVGDYVKAAEVEGTVAQLGLFTTRILTLKNEIVTIPNAVLAGQVTKNYSQAPGPKGVVVGSTITIGYDTPWRQVEGLLVLAAERTPGLKKVPSPWVHQRALTDFYVDYEVCAYIEDPGTRVPTLTTLHANILDAFNEYGVQITSPNYENDPETIKVVPREQWYAAPSRRRPGEGLRDETAEVPR
ncbi:MAG: mechanosensitive ion channel [Thermoanaerobaculia bacterium]